MRTQIPWQNLLVHMLRQPADRSTADEEMEFG